MSTWLWVVIVVAVVVVAIAISRLIRRRRTEALRTGFGPDTIAPWTAPATGVCRGRAARSAAPSRRARAPPARAARPQGLHGGLAGHAGRVRGRSGTAIKDADRLIQSVMRDRGYPVEDFDDRASIISVDHPVVVERYRSAHADRGRERRAAAATPRACGARCRTTARSSRSSSTTPRARDAPARQDRSAACPVRFPWAAAGGSSCPS